MKRFAVLLVFLSTLPALAAAAPAPGARLRIVPREAHSAPLSAHLVAIEPDRLTIRTDSGPRMLTPADVWLVEERRPGPGRSALGAALGFGIGMAAVHVAIADDGGGSSMFPGLAGGVALLGGATGGILGAVVGAGIREERWHPVAGWDVRGPEQGGPAAVIGTMRPGTQIRVTPSTAGAPTSLATVVRTEPDVVIARLEGGREMAFPSRQVLLIEQRPVSRERTGAIVGGLAGVAAGILIAGREDDGPVMETVQVLATTCAGAATGAVLVRAGSRRWEVVHGWDRRVADAALMPRMGLQFAWRW